MDSLPPLDSATPSAVENCKIHNMAANIAAFDGPLAPTISMDSFGTNNWEDILDEFISKSQTLTATEGAFE